MRPPITLLLMLTALSARADNPYGYRFTVSPNPVPAGSAIGVTIETLEVPCVALPAQLATTFEDDGIVYLTVPGSDGCDAVAAETRSYSLAPLPAGSYRFRFYQCAGLSAETGEEACHTLEEVAVTVRGASSGKRATIPSVSLLGLIVLAMALAGLGMRGFGRAR